MSINYKDKETGEYRQDKVLVKVPSDIRQEIEQNTEDVRELKAALTRKIEKPADAPAVGKVLKVKSVNADGSFVCEWADDAAGQATDVQINGGSITENGVANIPIGYGGVIGLTQLTNNNAYSGLQSSASDKTLRISRATDSDIDAKTQLYKPITPSNLDRAVRAGLISNSQITDDDKPLICQTIGAEPKKGDWVLKCVITTENKDDVNFPVDMSGCTEMVVYAEGKSINGGIVSIHTNYGNCIYNAFTDSGKWNYASFRDGIGCIDPVSFKGAPLGIDVTTGTINSYMIMNASISGITYFSISGRVNCSTCDIKVYAR